MSTTIFPSPEGSPGRGLLWIAHRCHSGPGRCPHPDRKPPSAAPPEMRCRAARAGPVQVTADLRGSRSTHTPWSTTRSTLTQARRPPEESSGPFEGYGYPGSTSSLYLSSAGQPVEGPLLSVTPTPHRRETRPTRRSGSAQPAADTPCRPDAPETRSDTGTQPAAGDVRHKRTVAAAYYGSGNRRIYGLPVWAQRTESFTDHSAP
jgi:hypothetical protein